MCTFWLWYTRRWSNAESYRALACVDVWLIPARRDADEPRAFCARLQQLSVYFFPSTTDALQKSKKYECIKCTRVWRLSRRLSRERKTLRSKLYSSNLAEYSPRVPRGHPVLRLLLRSFFFAFIIDLSLPNELFRCVFVLFTKLSFFVNRNVTREWFYKLLLLLEQAIDFKISGSYGYF